MCASTARASGWSSIVQPAVADNTRLHYHALWRDKQSDYGGEIGH
jgi:hypothetical protein